MVNFQPTECAARSDLESWMEQTSEEISQTSNLERITVSNSFTAYADEQLTSSSDTLENSVSMLSHVFRYTAE